MAKCNFVEIDGKYLEGGGQILRNALSFSCILRRPVRITNIRANRPNPGLSNQHLYGLNLLVQITNAQVQGNIMKSTQVEFNPNKTMPGNYYVDTKTAASVSLVLQTALPVLIFSDGQSELNLVGGTNVGMAPQVDYMTEVLRPNLEQFGVTFDFDLVTRGYYPRGGGRCKVGIPPVKSLSPIDITDFGRLQEIVGWCYVAGRLPPILANNMKKSAEKELEIVHQNLCDCHVEAYKESSDVAKDNGSGVILKATTTTNCSIGSSSLGERNIDADALGCKAGKELAQLISSQVCVDSYTQDQLILYMALAKGESKMLTTALTNHTQTAIYVAELMTGAKFTEEKRDDNLVLLKCQGIGFVSDN